MRVCGWLGEARLRSFVAMTRRTRAKGKRGQDVEGRRVWRKRRRFISRTTRKCSNRTVPRRVSASWSVCACVRELVRAWPGCVCVAWGGCRAKVGCGHGGGPYYARRGPLDERTRRFGRSGSTLKPGIYCGNSFCSICRPRIVYRQSPRSSSFLKRMAYQKDVPRRASRRLRALSANRGVPTRTTVILIAPC